MGIRIGLLRSCQRHAGQIIAIADGSRQPQIGGGARQAVIGGAGDAGQHPVRGLGHDAKRTIQRLADLRKSRAVKLAAVIGGCLHFGDKAAYDSAALHRQLAGHHVDGLNAVSAFIDGGNADIAQILRGAGFFNEAHAAVACAAARVSASPALRAISMAAALA